MPTPETVETTPPLPLDLAKELMNLCQAESHPSNYSVGILDPGCGRWHRLQPPTAPSAVSYMSETVSLQELLRQNVLTLGTRLELGVQLASAVVQLHGTEWLGESWTSEQIFFFVRQDVQRRAPDGTWFRDPIIDKPFVRRAFGGSKRLSQPLQTSKLDQVADYDKCLFSLGIVLIELWFGRCFPDLKSSPDMQSSSNLATGDHGDYMAARHWTGKLTAESGESYLLAVMRCLGMSRPESSRYARRSLEDLTYKIEVHETVVKTLEENYQVSSMLQLICPLINLTYFLDLCDCCTRRLSIPTCFSCCIYVGHIHPELPSMREPEALRFLFFFSFFYFCFWWNF
jgi:hypothetical protein